MKVCTKCKEVLPLTDFSPDNHTRDGRHTACRECRKVYAVKRSAITPDELLSKHAQNLATHKTCSKCRETKPVIEFSKMLRTSDGYRPNCRECQKKDNREKYLKRKESKL